MALSPVDSGSVIGVPENWSFERQRAQSGTIAKRTVKRWGNGFLMLTPPIYDPETGDKIHEVYQWPQDRFLTKGRVKFFIDTNEAKNAVAEIVEDRYYVLCFKSGEAVSSDSYHWWIYDLLGDRWYGPSTQRNLSTLYYNNDNGTLLCGGRDNLEGFVLEYRGRNIKNVSMDCDLIGSFSDYGFPRVEKRYVRGWIKAKQEGTAEGGTDPLELIINTDGVYNNPFTQRISLEDPANQNLSNTGAVKETVTPRFHIHDANGRGTSINWQFKHNVLNADINISELEIEYVLRQYKKEARSA